MLKELLRGRWMNHPLHPILVHLPVGLWIASFVLDIAYFSTGNSDLAVSSYYCMALGLLGALLAVPTGLAEYQDIPVSTLPRRVATLHLFMNLVIMLFYVGNLISRFKNVGDSFHFVTVQQLFLSILSVFLLSISGYLGGRLVYYYGIGQQRHRMASSERLSPEKQRKSA
jgi:uncharacterized membrane protein